MKNYFLDSVKSECLVYYRNLKLAKVEFAVIKMFKSLQIKFNFYFTAVYTSNVKFRMTTVEKGVNFRKKSEL